MSKTMRSAFRKHISRLLAATYAISMLTALPSAAYAEGAYPDVTYQYSTSFEEGTVDPNIMEEQIGNEGNTYVITDEVGAPDGDKAIRFQWYKAHFDPSERHTKSAEIRLDKTRADWGKEFYESFWYYFPSDTFGDSLNVVVKQWIGWHAGIPESNKTFSISVEGGKMYAHMLWNDWLNESYATPYDEAFLLLDEVPKDRWVKFNINAKFDIDSPDGFIDLWIDEEHVLSKHNVRFGVGNTVAGPYAKYGPYVWNSSSDHEVVAFYADDIKYGYEKFFDLERTIPLPEMDSSTWEPKVKGSADLTFEVAKDKYKGEVTIEYDVTPYTDEIGGLVAFMDSSTMPNGYANQSIAVNINKAANGQPAFFNVRNGAVYTYDQGQRVDAVVGTTYRIKIAANLSTKKYSVWITPQDGSETRIATDYDFRAGSPAIDDVGRMMVMSEGGTSIPAFLMTNLTINGDIIAKTPIQKPGAEPEPSDTTKFVPTDDAFIFAGGAANEKDVNRGSSPELVVKGSANKDYERYFIMKIDYSDLDAPYGIKNAVLSLNSYYSQGGAFPLSVIGFADTSWTEDSVTYNNQPNYDNGVVIATKNVSAAGTYQIDITDYVRENKDSGVISLLFKDLSYTDQTIGFSSTEAANQTIIPYLTITPKEEGDEPDPTLEPTSEPEPEPVTAQYAPTDDTYIFAAGGGEADMVRGNTADLRLRGNGGATNNGYFIMKFDYSDFTAPNGMESAVLDLYSNAATGTEFVVSVIGFDDISWSESTMTYNNQPNYAGSGEIAEMTVKNTGAYQIDITEYVNAMSDTGVISLLFKETKANTNKWIDFRSKEHNVEAQRPTLTLTAASDPVEQPFVEAVTVKSPPAVTEYTEGEALNLGGLAVTLAYSDGTTEDVTYGDFAGNGIVTSIDNGAVLAVTDDVVIITHTASGQSVSLTITVTEAEEPEAMLITGKLTAIESSVKKVAGAEIGFIFSAQGADNAGAMELSLVYNHNDLRFTGVQSVSEGIFATAVEKVVTGTDYTKIAIVVVVPQTLSLSESKDIVSIWFELVNTEADGIVGVSVVEEDFNATYYHEGENDASYADTALDGDWAGVTLINPDPYDVNDDGVVDLLDVEAVSKALGTTESVYDFNSDGLVDITDLTLIMTRRANDMLGGI